MGRRDATPAKIQIAKDSLFQILILFAKTEKISRRYKLNAKTWDDLSAVSIDDIEPRILSLSNKTKALAIKRQKRSRILKTPR